MSTKAQVLVQLLEKVPNADKLQRLLEPENLLYLLQQYGYQKEDLQQRLKNGTLPGELLLDLLEQEPDSEYLLRMLNDTMDTKVEKRVVIDEIIRQKQEEEAATMSVVAPLASTPAPESGTAPKRSPSLPQMSLPSASDEGRGFFENHYLTIALVIFSATSVAPALMRSGFFSDALIAPEIATLIAFGGGALTGAIFAYGSASTLWKSILIGIVLNLGVLWMTIVYTQARTELFKIEIVIPLALGSLPALALYWLLARKKSN